MELEGRGTQMFYDIVFLQFKGSNQDGWEGGQAKRVTLPTCCTTNDLVAFLADADLCSSIVVQTTKLIGASLSEPHMDRMTSPASYLCMYESIYVCVRHSVNAPSFYFIGLFEFTFVIPRVLGCFSQIVFSDKQRA